VFASNPYSRKSNSISNSNRHSAARKSWLESGWSRLFKEKRAKNTAVLYDRKKASMINHTVWIIHLIYINDYRRKSERIMLAWETRIRIRMNDASTMLKWIGNTDQKYEKVCCKYISMFLALCIDYFCQYVTAMITPWTKTRKLYSLFAVTTLVFEYDGFKSDWEYLFLKIFRHSPRSILNSIGVSLSLTCLLD
jgi:hypothetical protein